MKQDKTYLINKIFNNENIRTIWDKDEEKYYISVVDVVGILSESKDGRKYWNMERKVHFTRTTGRTKGRTTARTADAAAKIP